MKKNIKTILVQVTDVEKFQKQWDIWFDSMLEKSKDLEEEFGFRVVGASHEDEFDRVEKLENEIVEMRS